jgi:hypothetical protein
MLKSRFALGVGKNITKNIKIQNIAALSVKGLKLQKKVQKPSTQNMIGREKTIQTGKEALAKIITITKKSRLNGIPITSNAGISLKKQKYLGKLKCLPNANTATKKSSCMLITKIILNLWMLLGYVDHVTGRSMVVCINQS